VLSPQSAAFVREAAGKPGLVPHPRRRELRALGAVVCGVAGRDLGRAWAPLRPPARPNRAAPGGR
jgi:hypothetical protein